MVTDDLKKTNSLFTEHIAPALIRKAGGKFTAVEGVDDPMSEDFDRLAGIDYWFRSNDGQIYGIASRVQVADKNWRTFTVRFERGSGYETEYEKRLRSIKSGSLSPAITLQAYIVDDSLYIGLVRTETLIRHIEEGERYKVGRVNEGGRWAKFYIVDWVDVKAVEHRFKLK